MNKEQYENTIVNDVKDLVVANLGALTTIEGADSVVQRLETEFSERMQRLKEEGKSERKKLEQRLERLEKENGKMRRGYIEAEKRIWQVGFIVVVAICLYHVFL